MEWEMTGRKCLASGLKRKPWPAAAEKISSKKLKIYHQDDYFLRRKNIAQKYEGPNVKSYRTKTIAKGNLTGSD